MDTEHTDVPRIVADKFADRCWAGRTVNWSAPREDLRQEAELVAIRARQTYNPEKGPLRGYLWRAVAQHLNNYMWDMGSPVVSKHRRSALRGLRVVEADDRSIIPNEETPESALQVATWRVKVARRAALVVGVEMNVDLPEAMLTPEALTRLLTSKATTKSVKRLRETLRGDRRLQRLWQERKAV